MTTETHYDLNIYVGDYSTLSVCAYELEYSTTGNLQMNSSKWLTFEIPLSYKHNTLIANLLGVSDWENQVWVDHDDWVDKDFIIKAIEESLKAKEGIAVDLLMWLEALPEYEAVDHRAGEYKHVDPWRDAVDPTEDAVDPAYVAGLIDAIIAGATSAGADPEVADWVSDVLLLGDLTRRPVSEVTEFRIARRQELRNDY